MKKFNAYFGTSTQVLRKKPNTFDKMPVSD